MCYTETQAMPAGLIKDYEHFYFEFTGSFVTRPVCVTVKKVNTSDVILLEMRFFLSNAEF